MSAVARLLALSLLTATLTFAQQAPSFSGPHQYGPIRDYPGDFSGVDVNNDGHTDLIAISGGDAGSSVVLNVFLNNGDGTFNGPIVEPGTTQDTARMAIADFNGDGNLDVALATYQTFNDAGVVPVNTGKVEVRYGDGAGHFSAGPVVSIAPGNPNAIAVGDFNGDGKFDIAVSDANNKKITLLLNNGSGGFNKSSFTATTYWDNLQPGTTGPDTVRSLVAGDFDGNGRMDLAYVDVCNNDSCPDVPEEDIWTALNNGNGTFTAATVGGSTGMHELRSSDIDLDGKSDLYFAYTGCHTPCYGVTVLFSNDGRSFTATNPANGDTNDSDSPNDVVAADFNNDGRIDVAFTSTPELGNANPGFDVVTATGKRTWSAGFTHFPLSTNTFTTLITTGFLHSSYRKDVALIDGNENVQVFGNAAPNASGTCGYNSSVGIHICAPGSGSTVASPVRVFASFHPQHYPTHRTEIWVDGVKKLQVYNDRVDSSFALAGGTHTVAISGVDMTNRPLKKTYTFTVGSSGSTSCSTPTSAGVHICTPASGSSVSSPVSIHAAARAGSGNITAMRVYIDGVAKLTQNNPSASTTMQLSTSVSVATGSHTLSVVGYQSTGGAVKTSETFSVK